MKYIYYLKNNTFSNSNKDSKEKIQKYNLTTTTFFDQNYDLINKKDSSYNSKYEKEILCMTGIYNTKREKSKTKLTYSSKKDKTPKNIISNYKLSYNLINKRPKNSPTNLTLLSITNITGELKLKNNINKSIPYLKKYKIYK